MKEKAILVIMVVSIIAYEVFAFNNALPWHTLDEIVISASNPVKIDENNDGKIDKDVIEQGTLKEIKYVVGYMNRDEKGILWKSFHETIDFNEVFAEQTWTDCNSCNCCEHPFDHNYVNYKGLRCRNENGWYLVGCAYARQTGIVSTHHELQNNACIVGYDELSNGDLTIGCIKIE